MQTAQIGRVLFLPVPSVGKSRLIRANSERYTVRIITETNENYRSYPTAYAQAESNRRDR